jgi:hypothetical protein
MMGKESHSYETAVNIFATVKKNSNCFHGSIKVSGKRIYENTEVENLVWHCPFALSDEYGYAGVGR